MNGLIDPSGSELTLSNILEMGCSTFHAEGLCLVGRVIYLSEPWRFEVCLGNLLVRLVEPADSGLSSVDEEYGHYKHGQRRLGSARQSRVAGVLGVIYTKPHWSIARYFGVVWFFCPIPW